MTAIIPPSLHKACLVPNQQRLYSFAFMSPWNLGNRREHCSLTFFFSSHLGHKKGHGNVTKKHAYYLFEFFLSYKNCKTTICNSTARM